MALAACGGITSEADYPDPDQDEMYRYGSLLGGEGGFNLLGPRRGGNEEEAGGIGVNSYLWRASLDTLSFMPIASADPFGGVILTDWYSPPETPDERFKVNLYILDRQLRADGLKASVFKQMRGPEGDWQDAGVNEATARQLEDTVLTRARQMRISQTAAQSAGPSRPGP
ncbi:MAG TPA: DUF3576 domain-containing protein [Arenibaculum sp.]|nr:DUF3576 domain-containing protein [Arenibaculum sp.]